MTQRGVNACYSYDMKSNALFEKILAVIMFLGIFYLLYLIIKILVLFVTLYTAGFILDGDPEAFQVSTAHTILIAGDYVLSILLAAYVSWKIVSRALKFLFAV